MLVGFLLVTQTQKAESMSRKIIIGYVVGLMCMVSSVCAGDRIAWIIKNPSTKPPGRVGARMVFDQARDQVIMFGGTTQIGTVYDDTWTWDGSNWTKLNVSGPVKRAYHSMAYDSYRQVSVVFGGAQTGAMMFHDTWEWNGSQWTQVATTGPLSRTFSSLAYMGLDGPRGGLGEVLFGGQLDGDHDYDSATDTQNWDGDLWSQYFPTNSPSARYASSMDLFEDYSYPYLFGGQDRLFTSQTNDLWYFDGGSWNQISQSGSWPGARSLCYFIYNPDRHTMTLFSGHNARWIDYPFQWVEDDITSNNTWEWDGTSWKIRNSRGPSRKAFNVKQAYDGAACYDRHNHQFVSFGGQATYPSSIRNLTVVSEIRQAGDVDCSGSVNFDDFDAFVEALNSEDTYRSIYPNCDPMLGDMDFNGLVDFNDIDAFIDCITNGGCD